MNDPAFPFINIIIPCYNSESTIDDCLKSVFDLDYPKDRYGVIVVDNGSRDMSTDIIEKRPCKLIVRPNINVGAVRNRGADVLFCDFFAFTDSDCIVPKCWLSDAVKYFEDENVGAVGGGCLAPSNGCWLEKVWVAGQLESFRFVKCLPASNFIVRKSVFDMVSGFDENLVAGEDDHLSFKISNIGMKLISIRSCFVIHLGYPKTIFSIIKRQIWHSKNSFEIRENAFDKMFIMSNVFMLSLLSIFFLIPLLPRYFNEILTLSIFNILVIVFMVSFKKLSNCCYDNKTFTSESYKFLQLGIIYFFFFVGRSIGLLLNYKNLLFKAKV